jgi:hypothetical protein
MAWNLYQVLCQSVNTFWKINWEWCAQGNMHTHTARFSHYDKILSIGTKLKCHNDLWTKILKPMYILTKYVQRFLVGKTEGKRHLEDLGVDVRIIWKRIFRKYDGESWTELMWIRIGTGGGLLWMRWWTLGFRKVRVISQPARSLLVSQKNFAPLT